MTILATYRGQTALIRRTMKEYEKKYAGLIQTPPNAEKKDKGKDKGKGKETEADRKNTISNSVKIHTVDMYQGDENDFVIVSLVRSNAGKKIGFLSERNRRCVAQSRARCGIYFIGDCSMFYSSPTWKPMIAKMGDRGCIGQEIEIVCVDHPLKTVPINNADSMTLQSFCKEGCQKKMSCGRHQCQSKCQPPHRHAPCPEEVQFQHVVCGHVDIKKCEENDVDKKCEQTVDFRFDCLHTGKSSFSIFFFQNVLT